MLHELPFLASTIVLACTFLPQSHGVTSATEAVCATSASDDTKREFSLMQRNVQRAVTVEEEETSGSPLQKSASVGNVTGDEAHLIQLAASGSGTSVSAEQLAEWENEVEDFSKQLQQRREFLKTLHDQLSQAQSGKASEGNSPPAINSSVVQEQLIVPVPYYIHKRKERAHLGTRAVEKVTGWYGDIIGDALDPTSHSESGHGEHAHAHSHVAILFIFGALVLGALLQIMLDRWLPAIPYTCALFVVGMIISWIHWLNRFAHEWTSWYNSVEMWQDINPHLLFYCFLPALLFGDVMKLKVQLVAVCSGQVFLLACPGVLVGTGLTAMVAKFMLPYNWDWSICLAFGSILAATDPVAVVSLFNSLGVSPRLTMLISGESLVNDGTAIVCFALALKVAQGATLSPASVAYFFVYMIVPAIIIGFCVGFVCVALIGLCSEVLGESDAMIQVVVTICCGYLAFFISENEFSSSGVIATVSAGLAVAHSAWPLFVSRETVHIVWEAIEFVGNTVIFFLAGVIFMGHVLEQHFGVVDFTWLVVMYLGMFLIRAIMLALLWFPLGMAGQQIQWQEAVAMIWSGLRGAVSLAMGMIVDIEPGINNRVGSQVMFHVGGVAALTLLINAVTVGPLLRVLGLVKEENLINKITTKLSTSITEGVKKTFDKELRNTRDVRFHGANSDLVISMVPILQPQEEGEVTEESRSPPRTHHNHLTFLNEQIEKEWQSVQVFREVFLHVVQSRYWEGIEAGVIPRQLMVSRVLLHSTEEALDATKQGIKDWDIIARHLHVDINTGSVNAGGMFEKFLSKLVGVWPFRLIPQFRIASFDFQQMMTVFIALSYIEAHTFAQEEIPKSLGRDDALGVRVLKQVIHESSSQRSKALELVAHLPPAFVELGKSEMLARRLLRQHINEIEHKAEAGFLTQAEADHLCEPCHDALRNISKKSTMAWEQSLEDIHSKESGSPSESTEPRQPPGFGLGTLKMGTLPRGPSQVPLVDTFVSGTSSLYPASDQGAASYQGQALPGSGISQTHSTPVRSLPDSGLGFSPAIQHGGHTRFINPSGIPPDAAARHAAFDPAVAYHRS